MRYFLCPEASILKQPQEKCLRCYQHCHCHYQISTLNALSPSGFETQPTVTGRLCSQNRGTAIALLFLDFDVHNAAIARLCNHNTDTVRVGMSVARHGRHI